MTIPKIVAYQLPSVELMLENRVNWQLDPSRAVLLIHDMQQYFLNYYDTNAEPIPTVLANIQRIKSQLKPLGVPVIYSAQPGDQTPEQRALLQDFWGKGLTADISQTGIIDKLKPEQDDQVITKWRYSAFQRTELLQIMQAQQRDQLIICGIYAHIGCLLTAADAFMNDIKAFFISDAVADFTQQDHLMAINYAAQRCARTITTQQLLADATELTTITETDLPSNKQQLKQLIAGWLGVTSDELEDDDNLIECGLDSIRVLSLLDQFKTVGKHTSLIELAENPTIAGWSALLIAE
ncbi:isochorismatase family protein [Endozoicomonas sp. SM1973]|uniref:isochorismatase n=1 Tax=Spartinivicinus marinus TaxID=2994442 RepID=A0A853I2X8_9GAMM|nr:isochorismatase family protein [Spartinivicinus marinus]MCX4029494.1 isochorismatase family protein [Spartinivicinus marinus]NYZ65068.1 isochorismatase family protein [Spartinivicinus marinus]